MRAEPGIRVVIDTNVWIGAFLKETGAPATLVRWVVSHGVPVFSPLTFAELERRCLAHDLVRAQQHCAAGY